MYDSTIRSRWAFLGHISFVGSGSGSWIGNGLNGRWSVLGDWHGMEGGGWRKICLPVMNCEVGNIGGGGTCDAKRKVNVVTGGGADEA